MSVGDDLTRRRSVLCACALIWSATTVVVFSWQYRLSGLAFGLVLSAIPGLFLFGYVIRCPTTARVAALGSSMLIGVIVLFVNSKYMASASCTRDALCAVNSINPAVVEVVVFAIGVPVYSSVERRRSP